MLTFTFNPANTFTFNDGCKITKLANSLNIEVAGKNLSFSDENKPKFSNGKGESVIEYSGLATDGAADCSWALATFEKDGCSSAHYHNERTEQYYILSGQAKVMVDGKEHMMKAGDNLEIRPGQKHQVINTSVSEPLAIVVKCEPAWVFQDSHEVNSTLDADVSEKSSHRPS
jgi:mannose-6-phosphate isomerase-like protein (cupin superfamily)